VTRPPEPPRIALKGVTRRFGTLVALEDVDLVTARQKRYSYSDPLLRAWVRLHCRATMPTEDDLAREVHRYALPRLPQPQDPQAAPAETAYAMAASPSTGIIEID